MYGSVGMEENQNNEHVPLVVSEGGTDTSNSNFEDPFDSEFWTQVHKRYEEKLEAAKNKPEETGTGKSLWSKSLDEIRAERIRDKYTALGKDPVVAIMIDWLKYFYKTTKVEEQGLLRPNFENQLSKLALILIDEDCKKFDCPKDGKHKCEYGRKKRIFTDVDKTSKGLLHIAAEQNLYILTKGLIARFPGQLYVTSRGPDLSRIPVEYALLKYHDETASEMIKCMRHDRIRMLMEFDESEGRSRFKFRDFIQRSQMTRTVIAILDSLVNPDWPFIPYENKEKKEKEWSSVPDVPIRYHFFYRILDGDQEGRSPYLGAPNGVEYENQAFDSKASSCFKMLLQSPHKEAVISHPVMRMLARRKWDAFGAFHARLHAVVYIAFVILTSVALLCAVNSSNPLRYDTSLDYFRAVCEILTLIQAMVYLGLEIDCMEKERWKYLWDFQNYFDLAGMILLLTLVPLRLVDESAQWSIAAIAYLIIFLGLFKFLIVWQFVGLYVKVLTQLLIEDISKFMVVFLVLMFSFGGSIYLALKATGGLANISKNFGNLLFREVKALVEGNAFAESYSTFKLTVVILIMINMFMIKLILINMLIAHLSNRYGDAQNIAGVSFDIDKALIVAKLENSRFKKFNLRIKHYKDGDFAVNKKKVRDILTYWEKLKHQMREETLPGLEERIEATVAVRRDDYEGVVTA